MRKLNTAQKNEEILNGKLHFLRSVNNFLKINTKIGTRHCILTFTSHLAFIV